MVNNAWSGYQSILLEHTIHSLPTQQTEKNPKHCRLSNLSKFTWSLGFCLRQAFLALLSHVSMRWTAGCFRTHWLSLIMMKQVVLRGQTPLLPLEHHKAGLTPAVACASAAGPSPLYPESQPDTEVMASAAVSLSTGLGGTKSMWHAVGYLEK